MFHKLKSGQKIYYELIGNYESKKTLVFLNGLSQSTLSWGLMIPFFSKDYKIVLLDFVFQGQSDKQGEYKSFDEHSRDVNELMDLLYLENVNMIGISYGSLVAQHFTLLYPEKVSRLVLMATFAHKTPYLEAIENSWWRSLETGGYSLLLDVMLPSVLSENYFLNPLIPIDAMKQSRKEINEDPQALFKLMRATRERQDYREKLKEINQDTLILHGEKDLLIPFHLAEAVHHSIRNSSFVLLKGKGHTLNLEAVEESSKAILSFLH
jgi:3-oxoadipate enol-lactonase